MSTTSRYGSTSWMKKRTAEIRTEVRSIAITKPTVSGTEAADASAAASALRGGLGIITVKLDIHTATHDRPTNVEFAANRPASRNWAAAIPKLPTTSNTSPSVSNVSTATDLFHVSAATTRAVAIEIVDGAHPIGVAKKRARSS